MLRRSAAAIASMIALVGCAGPASPGDASSAPASPAAVANGSVYTVLWGGEIVIATHSIAEDGTVGPAAVLHTEPDSQQFTGVVDGVGSIGVLGTYTDYWTSALRLYTDGQPTGEIAVESWCGGEGLTYNPCVVLDDTRLARTSELGRDPVSGEGPDEGSVTVSSIVDGSTQAEYGPVPDLVNIVGTTSPDHIMLVTSPHTSMEESSPSTVHRLDVIDGTMTEIGTSEPGWAALCAIGDDSVLGFTSVAAAGRGSTSTASVVGPAQIADVGWDDEDAVGCSADGRFLYLHSFPQPPSGEDDTEPPNPPTAMDRVDLADGRTDPVLILDPGVQVALITR